MSEVRFEHQSPLRLQKMYLNDLAELGHFIPRSISTNFAESEVKPVVWELSVLYQTVRRAEEEKKLSGFQVPIELLFHDPVALT